MFGADVLLERLDRIYHNFPCYYLSNSDAPITHRTMYSTSNYQMLQGNLKKLAEKRIKNSSTPLQRIRLKSCVGSPRKNHCLELMQPHRQKVNILELKNISINSSKAAITRQEFHRTSGYFSKSPYRSPKTKHLTVNVPKAMQNQ